MALTAKQELFVQEYLVDLNATQAAIRAGYSEKTAAEIGRQNLIKLEIAQAITEARTKRSERVEWTTDEILKDLKEIALDRNVEVQHRIKAYELGGKHNGMWTEKIKIEGTLSVEKLLEGL